MSTKEELLQQLSVLSEKQHLSAFTSLEKALERSDFIAALDAQNQLFHIDNNIARMEEAIDAHFDRKLV